jgi:hypothetical protein
MTGMLDVLTAAVEVQRLCERHRWKFCFIGGIAVQRWGNPRFTVDVDLTLLTGYGSETDFIDVALEDLEPRRSDARSFAIRHRVLLARSSQGVDIDIALGALPFEARSVERASDWNLGDARTICTCSAEDLIVHKVFAGRDRDWDDVRGVLARRHLHLDWTIIRSELIPLLDLKETPEAFERLERMAADVKARLAP